MLNPYETIITEDHRYGFQSNGSNFGDFFATKHLRMKGKSQIFICSKKSCDSARRVVSYNAFIDFCITLNVLVLLKCVYIKTMLKPEMANI